MRSGGEKRTTSDSLKVGGAWERGYTHSALRMPCFPRTITRKENGDWSAS